MSLLSVEHRVALEAVVQACADGQLTQLASAVRTLAGERAAEVAALISEERRDRARRDLAFGPLAPLFQPRSDGVAALTFPPSLYVHLWREARKGEEEFLGLLDAVTTIEGEWTLVADRLCARAAAVLRNRAAEVWPDHRRPAEGEPPATPLELAACFDLTPLARGGLARLPVWLERPDDTQLAGLRLLIQDALSISPEGDRRMVDILFAHVTEADRMLRVVTRTSRLADREAVLSHTDMGVFVERLLASVQDRVRRIGLVRPQQCEALQEVVLDVNWCASVLSELDMTLQVRPDSPWGRSTRLARVQLSGQLSGLIKSTQAAVHAALPMRRQTLAGRMTRMSPWLEAPWQGEPIETAAALVNVMVAVRWAAVVFGCESDNHATKTEIIDYLTVWANEALDSVGDGEAPDPDLALRLVGVAARLLTGLEALEDARAIRRRAAAAETLDAKRPIVAGASPARA
ncbi:hypothetical protein [Brevundimonas sp. SORGH_AS_0993]|uniref:hypothetical protein n=1 Tax=Brevundimonas sp. SORGH_AS_0993 TaxID=3041794 RepID=UPI00278A5D30|nr:hypothetical protein [Brevundimonas sp. SORGH_AS_0993]MDQ1155537.1 hypothetical protein [Brevundimonas sp. SORGH_AS_0993]